MTLARWRAHPLCASDVPWPARYWGPERLDPIAWRELAARLDPRAEIAALVAAVGDARVIADVGGGTGLLTRALAARGRCVVIEPSAAQVDGLPADLAARLAIVRGRAEALPLATGAVDAAVATWVLQYTDDPDAAVAELARVARATVAIVQAAPDNALVRAYNASAAIAGAPPAHHGYLLARAAARLDAAGFTVALARVPVAVGGPRAGLASTVVRLHFAGHPRLAEMIGACDLASGAADDGVLLVARRGGA